MNARLKSFLVIFATLLIGVVLSAVVNARMSEQRIERIAAYRSERGFIRYLERGIEPRDEAQQEEIREILSGAAARTAERSMQYRMEMRRLIDSTHAELADILTPEQQQRLREHLEVRPRHRRGPRGEAHRGRGRGPVD